MRRLSSLHPLRGVRVRTALAAVLVVAVALGLAAAALVVLQRRELVLGLSTVAQQQGNQVAAQIIAGGTESVDIPAVSGRWSRSARPKGW